MKHAIDIYPYGKKPISNSENQIEKIENYLSEFFGQKSLVLGSARCGIYQALSFFKLSRMDHVLVPDFLCQSILNILNTSSFPVKYPDQRTKAILLFHQWGYPQKIDEIMAEAKSRGWIVIEDCAHSFDSKYKGKNIGTFGDASVFSFAKMFTTYSGGVFSAKGEAIIDSIKDSRKKVNSKANKFFNILADWVYKKSFEEAKHRFWLDLIYLKSINYPNASKKAIDAMPCDRNGLEKALLKRKENYLKLKNNLKREYLPVDFDETIDPNPICVPVFVGSDKLKATQEALKKNGIEVDVMHFDVNRNMLSPNYQKCLAVPCHQQISQEQINKMIEIINYG